MNEPIFNPETVIARKRDSVFSSVIVSISILSFIMMLYNFLTAYHLAGMIDLVIGSGLLLSYWLHKTGFNKTGKILSLVTLNIGVFVFARSHPLETGMYLLFLPLIVLANVIFLKNENRYRYLFAFLPVACIIAIFAIGKDYIVSQVMSAADIEEAFLINLGCSLIVLFLTLFIHTHIGNQTEKWLKDFALEASQRSERLKKANAQLDRFLLMTIHDLRSPLASVKGLVSFASKEINDPLMETVFEKIIERIDHLDTFSRELIEYAKNALADPRYELADLSSIASEIIESLRFLNGADKIRFYVDAHEKQKFLIDKKKMTMIMSNLVANAIKYHRLDQDSPFVGIMIHEDETEGKLVITVADNGNGISHEYHEKIFEMFFRAAPDSSGSGLGLFMVKEAISKMKGQIQLKSMPGLGSAFSITLPLQNHLKVHSNLLCG